MNCRYRIVNPLESGPDVSVYAVDDLWEGGARKVLHLLPTPYTREASESLLEEAESAFSMRRSMAHPCLIPVTDIAFRGRRPGFVTGFLTGKPLAENDSVLPFNETLTLALKIISLVHYLHQRNFLIGYLTPSRFFVDRRGDLQATIALSGRLLARRDLGKHSVAYVSPEFVTSRTISREGDYYSLGMLLYSLFTGVQPFAERDRKLLETKQISSSPTPPRQVNPDIPEAVEEFLLRLLNKDPRKRDCSTELLARCAKLRGIRSLREEVPFKSDFVGREYEVIHLKNVLNEFRQDGPSRLVAIEGSGGIGRTRLCQQVSAAAKLGGFQVLHLAHHPNSGILGPWRAWIELVSGSLNVEGPSPGLDARDASPLAPVDHVLSSLSKCQQEGKLALILEDVQWMDEASSELLLKILRQPDLKLLIILTRRSDAPAPVWEALSENAGSAVLLDSLVLQALTTTEIKVLLSSFFQPPVESEVVAAFENRSGGVPIRIIELLQHLQRDGHITFAAGRWVWRSSNRVAAISRASCALSADFGLQLQRLDRRERVVVEVLAVFGRPVRLDTLVRLLATPLAETWETILKLQRRELVLAKGDLASTRLELAHEKLRADIEGAVGPQRKRSIHGAISETLRFEHEASGDEFLLVPLAFHLVASGSKSPSAAKTAWKAIEFLQDRFLYSDALDLLEFSLRRRVIKNADWRAMRTRVELSYRSGEMDKCARLIAGLLRQRGLNDEQTTDLLLLRSRIELIRGRVRSGLNYLDQAVEIARGGAKPNQLIESEIELLCSLSRTSHAGKARKVAESLLSKRKRSDLDGLEDRLHHALFLYESFLGGNLQSAEAHELRSVRSAVRKSNITSAVGRIYNLGNLLMETGRIREAERLVAYSRKLAAEIGHVDLEAYCEMSMVIRDRKLGYHEAALSRLSCLEAEACPGKLARNMHFRAELSLEFARNANYLLDLSAAFSRFHEVSQILARFPVSSTEIDSRIVHGWTWLIAGEPAAALRQTESLADSIICREKGRFSILLSAALLDSGDCEAAWFEAGRAWTEFPETLPYGRARVRLLQAEILLRAPHLGSALPYIKSALTIARSHFYFPHWAKACLLKAKWLLGDGDLRGARSFCLRASQLSQKLDRPALLAEICHTLGRIASESGEAGRAMEAFDTALQLLKEKVLMLPAEYKGGFTKKYILPIERDRAKVAPPARHPVPNLVGRIRDFTYAAGGLEDYSGLLRRLANTLEETVPTVAANFFLRDTTTSGSYQIVASVRRCQQSGRHLLDLPEDPEQPAKRVNSLDEQGRSLKYYLTSRGERIGMIYIEKTASQLAEVEFDFLLTVVQVAQLALEARPTSSSIVRSLSARHSSPGQEIVGSSPQILKVLDEIRLIAPTEATVLIEGESGTGKELLARALHQGSNRRGQFVAVNCSTLPADLIESELFGHAQGSFTGALATKLGLFEAAAGGTLFLDEISTMPLDLQSRLLRVLQEKRIRRLGETGERKISARIVAATNQNLKGLVKEGAFRDDLYHRLNAFKIEVPPLRSRRSDIPQLASHFLSQIERGGKRCSLSSGAVAALKRHDFPGNVRELRNLIESLYYRNATGIITGQEVIARLPDQLPGQARDAIDNQRVSLIVDALLSRKVDFGKAVRDPFINRDLARNDVREIVAAGLRITGGSYLRLTELFGLHKSEYKSFLGFLANHDCKVDYRRFRTKR